MTGAIQSRPATPTNGKTGKVLITDSAMKELAAPQQSGRSQKLLGWGAWPRAG